MSSAVTLFRLIHRHSDELPSGAYSPFLLCFGTIELPENEVLSMIRLSDDQLNNLNKEALIILVSSLQDQLTSVQEQLDMANLEKIRVFAIRL